MNLLKNNTVFPISTARIVIPEFEIWYAEVVGCELPDSGQVDIEFEGSLLKGTVVPERSSTFVHETKLFIVGGFGGWRKELPSKQYTNDASVKPKEVITDLCLATGEQMGSSVSLPPVGDHWTRSAGTAATSMTEICGDPGWFVAADGKTMLGPRPSAKSSAALVDFDQTERKCRLDIDSFSQIVPGMTIENERLPYVFRVSSVEIVSEGNGVDCYAYGSDRVADALKQIITRTTKSLDGIYRYQVVGMVGDRAILKRQSGRKDLPNFPAVNIWFGVPGIKAQLKSGSEVLVQFIDGSPSSPVITGFCQPGHSSHHPDSLDLGSSGSARPVARQGDPVTILLPPCMFNGTMNGAPAAGVITFLVGQTTGAIMAGNPKVLA